MATEEHIIDANTYIYYSDYYAIAARAGIERSKAVFEVINPALRIDSSTFDLFDSADLSINNLINTIRTSYNISFIESRSLEPMSDAFNGLANHIKKWVGGTLDQFLTAEGIEVDAVYARISGRLGETISSGNTRG